MEPKKDEKRIGKFPFKKKKKKIKLPFNDLASLPSEEEYGNTYH